jgi:1-acyl-sn-glycerol-3-phosphate acyltransferase
MMDGIKQGALVWSPPVWRDIVRWPLPHKGFGDRLLLRAVALVTKRQVRAIHGLGNLPCGSNSFIIAANHSSRRDAVILPAFLMLHRGGSAIHFLADWNFKLIPGVGLLYRRAGAIIVPRKPARPRFLNVFKPYLVDPVSPIDRARQHLAAGRPVALFPEGTVNSDQSALLAGRHGAARLSLEAGVPVVPMGLRFPDARGKHLGAMEIHIGALLHPPNIETETAPLSVVRNWHATLMSEISLLSGKSWQPRQGEPT